MSRWLTALVVCVCVAGCRRPGPPQRPMALLFPTVYPATVLDNARPVSCTVADIRATLTAAGLDHAAWIRTMPHDQFEVLARGLRERGYAEVDGRRVGESLVWVTFRGTVLGAEDTPALVVTSGYRQVPPGPVSAPLMLREGNAEMITEFDPYGHLREVVEWGPGPEPERVSVRRFLSEEALVWVVRRVVPKP